MNCGRITTIHEKDNYMKNIIYLNLNDIKYMAHILWTSAFNDWGKYGEIHFLIDYDNKMMSDNSKGRYYYTTKEIMLSKNYSNFYDFTAALCHELAHHYCNINNLNLDHDEIFIKTMSAFDIDYENNVQILGTQITFLIYSLFESKNLLRSFNIDNTEIKLFKRKSNFNSFI